MKRGLIATLISLVSIPLISAYSAGDWGSPQYYLDNEWVKFGIVFILLFASIYTFFKNRTNNNAAVSGIAAIGISLLLIIPIMRRGLLEAFLGDSVVDWILIASLIIGVFFMLYALFNKFEWKGILLGILGLTLFPVFINLNQIIPETLMQGTFGEVIYFIQDYSSFIMGAVIIILIWRFIKWIRSSRTPRAPSHNVNVNVNHRRNNVNTRQEGKINKQRQKSIELKRKSDIEKSQKKTQEWDENRVAKLNRNYKG